MVIKDLTVEEMAGLTSLEFDILCDRVWRRIRKELRQGLRREALPAPGETDSDTTMPMVHSISASIAEGGRHVALHGDALMDGRRYEVIFDIGSSDCVVPEEVAKTTGRPIVPCSHIIKTANGVRQPKGQIKGIQLTVGKRQYLIDVMVMPSDAISVILIGNSWLGEHQILIDMRKGELVTPEGERIPVRSTYAALKVAVEDEEDSGTDFTSDDDVYFLEIDAEFEKGPIINNDLTKEQFERLAEVVCGASFADRLEDFGHYTLVQHKIETGDARSVRKKRCRRML